jgi:hypothetical protein
MSLSPVGKEAYETSEQGSIVLNSFLEKCTRASSINDIFVNINNGINNPKELLSN